jgi:hypothetical protein
MSLTRVLYLRDKWWRPTPATCLPRGKRWRRPPSTCLPRVKRWRRPPALCLPRVERWRRLPATCLPRDKRCRRPPAKIIITRGAHRHLQVTGRSQALECMRRFLVVEILLPLYQKNSRPSDQRPNPRVCQLSATCRSEAFRNFHQKSTLIR